MTSFKQATQKLLLKISKMLPENKSEALDPTADVFLDALTIKQLTEVKKSGEKFLELTALIRANYWYNKKDEILDIESNAYKGLDPRSLNYMLDDVINFPAQILSEVDRRLGEKDVEEK